MSPENLFPRRSFLKFTTNLAAVTGLIIATSSPALADNNDEPELRRNKLTDAEERHRRLVPGWNTPNGWPAETATDAGGTIWTREVPGTAVALTARDGEPRALLEHVIQRFNLEIQTVASEDVKAFDASARGKGPAGNHASGTAISILPSRYPKGSKQMFDFEIRAVQDILKSCSGLVGWGGDEASQSQGFFYLKVPPKSADLATWVKKRDDAREQLGTAGNLQVLGT